MKTIAKLALGGLMLAGTAAATVSQASAGVTIGVNVGAPGVAMAYGGACYRPLRIRPAYCGYPVYRGPLFVDGVAYRAPVAFRYEGKERFFWLHNGWVRDRVDFHRDHDGFRR